MVISRWCLRLLPFFLSFLFFLSFFFLFYMVISRWCLRLLPLIRGRINESSISHRRWRISMLWGLSDGGVQDKPTK
jgi:hypothetical protein